MRQWGVVDFVSRVAERVNPAWGGAPLTIVDLAPADEDEHVAFAQIRTAMPFIEPSPDYVVDLYRRLMLAPIAVESDAAGPDRRIVYGAAALGSLASAAVVAALVLRTRAAHRAA